MKRKALYSRARRARVPTDQGSGPGLPYADWFAEPPRGPGLLARSWTRFRALLDRRNLTRPALAAALVLLAVSLSLSTLYAWHLANPGPPVYTQWDIDNAVKNTLDNTPPGPDQSSIAAAVIAPSLVRVDGYLSPEHAAEIAKEEALEAKKSGKKPEKPEAPKPQAKNTPPTVPATPGFRRDIPGGPGAPGAAPGTQTAEADAPHPDSTGSGVVINEQGDILTNLHVIRSTDRWEITFFDGSKSDAILVSMQPENDLAVIRAKRQPDDLKPATLASTRGLNPGDMVVAEGFPFGIGPSISSGVIAGLKREFDDPNDKEKPKMTNLIQFDAAVNPGNSGGPLVNRDGEVVGIVTAIYNPTGQRVFAGMAFAVPIENAAKAVGENPL
jgi:S1-C subfamily serine protease